jgi:DNA polymerase-1
MALYAGIKLTGQPDLENIRKLDLLPMRPITEIMRYGFAIDIPHLEVLTDELTLQMDVLRRKICDQIPADKLDQFMEVADSKEAEWDEGTDRSINVSFNADSAMQVRKLLFRVIGIGGDRTLKLTKTGDISTGKKQLEGLKLGNQIVQDILDYRGCSKLKGTYTTTMPKMALFHPESTLLRPRCPVCRLEHWADTWRIHTQILTTRTSTGRPATKKPNLQNIPVRSANGRRVRSAFIASPGTELVAVDFSQLELRILAHVARVVKMIACFIQDKDIHEMTAMEAFQIASHMVDKILHRAPAKNVNFAVVYGETAQGLYEQLVSDTYGKSGIPVPEWLTLEWCEAFLRKWFTIYPEVLAYMHQEFERAARYGHVWSLFGRVRPTPEIKSVHRSTVSAGQRQAGNMKIQGSGADMLKLAQAEIQDWIEQVLRPNNVWCWPVNEVHDELIFEVEEGLGKFVLKKCIDVMSKVMFDKDTGEDLFRVPVKAEGKVMQRWVKE